MTRTIDDCQWLQLSLTLADATAKLRAVKLAFMDLMDSVPTGDMTDADALAMSDEAAVGDAGNVLAWLHRFRGQAVTLADLIAITRKALIVRQSLARHRTGAAD